MADVWSCPGRASWSRRRVRAHVIRRVVLLAQLLLPRCAFVVAGSLRVCRMCSLFVGVLFDGVPVFVGCSVIGVVNGVDCVVYIVVVVGCKCLCCYRWCCVLPFVVLVFFLLLASLYCLLVCVSCLVCVLPLFGFALLLV